MMSNRIVAGEPRLNASQLLRSHVRTEVGTLIRDLRHFRNSSLAGDIDGLTPNLEARFIQGDFVITEKENSSPILMGPVSMSQDSETWERAGFRDNSLGERIRALGIYDRWRERAVDFPGGDPREAVNMFDVEFKEKYEIAVNGGGTLSAGKVFHIMTLLDYLPESVLKAQAIRSIFTSPSSSVAMSPGNYDWENRILELHPYSHFEKHDTTAFILRLLGLAFFKSLAHAEATEACHRVNDLIQPSASWPLPVIRSHLLRADDRQLCTHIAFATNFMHFVIFGDSILQALEPFPEKFNPRKRMFDFLASFYERPKLAELDISRK
ncbi:MAG: hypothetical protein WC527_07935 [Candidatus Margulisiibacteriota bacterium]